jgi:hypothetical protein
VVEVSTLCYRGGVKTKEKGHMGLKTRNTYKTSGVAFRIGYKHLMEMYPSLSEVDAKTLALGLKSVSKTTGATENWVMSELNEVVLQIKQEDN